MRRCVGLDLSLTCSGIGLITQRADGTCLATTSTVTSKGHRGDGLVERSRRIAVIAEEILHTARLANLVVLESMFLAGTKGGSLLDRAGLFHRVVSGLIRADVPITEVSPASLKLAIASSGRADKATVAVALSRLWPDVDVTSSDIADALGLAHLGAVAMGWPVKTLERHRAVKVCWPEFLDSQRGDSDAA